MSLDSEEKRFKLLTWTVFSHVESSSKLTDKGIYPKVIITGLIVCKSNRVKYSYPFFSKQSSLAIAFSYVSALVGGLIS